MHTSMWIFYSLGSIILFLTIFVGKCFLQWWWRNLISEIHVTLLPRVYYFTSWLWNACCQPWRVGVNQHPWRGIFVYAIRYRSRNRHGNLAGGRCVLHLSTSLGCFCSRTSFPNIGLDGLSWTSCISNLQATDSPCAVEGSGLTTCLLLVQF